MLNVGIIGAGNWGRNLVRTFASLEDVSLAWVCDLSEEVRAAVARQYPNAGLTQDADQVMQDDAVDAVVIAVDAPRHFELTRAALLAGKHVFVEKPLTLLADQAQELVDLADRAGKTLMVGHLLEYHPAIAYMKEAIATQELGSSLYLYSHRLNLGIVRNNENAWWSLAPHDIAIACYLFDAMPQSISACGHDYLQRGIEDVVFASMKFADGRMAHVHVSWLDPHKVRSVTLVGSKKMIVFDDMEPAEKIRVYDKGAEIKTSANYAEAITIRTGNILIPKIPSVEPLLEECRHFVRSVADGVSPRSDGRDGLRVVKVLEAGALSISRQGAPIDIA